MRWKGANGKGRSHLRLRLSCVVSDEMRFLHAMGVTRPDFYLVNGFPSCLYIWKVGMCRDPPFFVSKDFSKISIGCRNSLFFLKEFKTGSF